MEQPPGEHILRAPQVLWLLPNVRSARWSRHSGHERQYVFIVALAIVPLRGFVYRGCVEIARSSLLREAACRIIRLVGGGFVFYGEGVHRISDPFHTVLRPQSFGANTIVHGDRTLVVIEEVRLTRVLYFHLSGARARLRVGSKDLNGLICRGTSASHWSAASRCFLRLACISGRVRRW